VGIGTNSAVVCACCDVLLVLMVGHAGQQHIPLLQIMVKLYIGVNAVHMLHVSLLKFDGETTM